VPEPSVEDAPEKVPVPVPMDILLLLVVGEVEVP
jgi:hypothetical protein